MRLTGIFIAASMVVFAAFSPANAQAFVVNYPPSQYHQGGTVADTSFMYFGSTIWNDSADSFTTSADSDISTFRWWAYFQEDKPTPSAAEIVELLIYTPRVDGLPGNPVFDQQFSSPSRAQTGVRISDGVLPHEYVYNVNLSTPFHLAASRYWFEVRAIGDLQSTYVWEYGYYPNPNVFALANPRTLGDWQLSALANISTAFQIEAVPEPATGLLACSAALMCLRRVSHLRAGASRP